MPVVPVVVRPVNPAVAALSDSRTGCRAGAAGIARRPAEASRQRIHADRT
jgi:hypothetical protein